MKKYNIAVVGATGAVGREMIRQIEASQIPVERLLPLASARSAGTTVHFKGEQLRIEEAKPEAFAGIDVALFSAGGSVSKALIPEVIKQGVVTIDNSSAFRMTPGVPLVVPEVNPQEIFTHQGIIANPNCSTIQMVVALEPIRKRYGLKRVVVSTYQAVSGSGAAAVQETLTQTKAYLDNEERNPEILPVGSLPVKYQIAFNAIPQIDQFEANGFTLEEMKMVQETKKIFDQDSIEVAATCVRIPVLTGHSESVYIETEEDVNVDDVRELLASSPGIIVIDEPEQQKYPMPIDAAGKRDVFVGRIRKDLDRNNGLHLWVVSDNLIKGAAWNSVQILKTYIEGQ